MAWYWEKFSENKRLIALQTEAYKAEKGLWSPDIVNRIFID
jgi:endonuclease YncB( thermonuclease family)